MSRRAEWQNVVDAETTRWSAMSCGQLVAALHDTQAYEVEFESERYQVEVELLEDTDRYSMCWWLSMMEAFLPPSGP